MVGVAPVPTVAEVVHIREVALVELELPPVVLAVVVGAKALEDNIHL